MKFINYPVLWMALSLTTGIILSYSLPALNLSNAQAKLLLFLSVLGTMLLFGIWWKEKHKLVQKIYFGIGTCLCFILIGFTNYELRKPENQPIHFVHSKALNGNHLIQLEVLSTLPHNQFNDKYTAEVYQLNGQKVAGKLLLSLKKDSATSLLRIGQKLLVNGRINEIKPPLNPDQFNYKNYLKNQRIIGQLKVSEALILKKEIGKRTLQSVAESIRNGILTDLKKTGIQPKQRAILQALVLGYKNDIEHEQKRQFAAAGALHILAVSGLHVGVLFLILSKLLTPLSYLKFGSRIKAFIIICLLWGFALLAGWSPSVVRAVTMFSFFAMAQMLDRPSTGFNTLLLSYVLLLLCKPEWLFHLGFQLSYVAVISILWIQPMLYKLYIPRNFLDRLLWGIFTVTIAAQLGVAPLSLFYFHQFPGLFFITNLVILPFISVLLIGGIVVILLVITDNLPSIMAHAYDWMLLQLQHFIGWVARQEAFIFDSVSFSVVEMIFVYLLIGAIVIWWKLRKPKQLLIVFSMVALLFLASVSENKRAHHEELLIFHSFGKTIIGHQHGRSLTVYKTDSLALISQYPLSNFISNRRISNVELGPIPDVFTYKSDFYIRLDSLGIYPNVKESIVLLTSNSKVHLGRMIDSLKPKHIIADGSNFPSYIERWKSTCKIKQIPFYYTGEDGALCR